jgi:hypothetical protein
MSNRLSSEGDGTGTAAAAAMPEGGGSQILMEADAAMYIGMSRAFLRASRGGRCDGPAYIQAGRSVRYRLRDLDEWLEAHCKEPLGARRPSPPSSSSGPRKARTRGAAGGRR